MSTSGIIQDLWQDYQKTSGRKAGQIEQLADPVDRLVAATRDIEGLIAKQKGPPDEGVLDVFYGDIASLDAAVSRFFRGLDGFVAADERLFKSTGIGGQITLQGQIPQWQEQDRQFGGNLQAALQDLMMTAQSVLFPDPAPLG